jgi:HEPN domain-containing protein
MTNLDLARSYFLKVEKRLKALEVLFKEEDYSDVIREGQEIVELCAKGMLRMVGIEPPKYHDVSALMMEHRARFAGIPLKDLKRIARISKTLRKERELAFYGDIDFIPTEEYRRSDAARVMKDTLWLLNVVRRLSATQ